MEALTYQEAEQMVKPGEAMSWVGTGGVQLTTLWPRLLDQPFTALASMIEVNVDFMTSYKVRFFI